MYLITSELTKYKTNCEKVTKNNELIQTELNLLNKLLFFEQKYSKHMNELFLCYDKNFNSIQNNYKYFVDWNELKRNKLIAKQNKTELNKLRQELNDWRVANNRLNNDISLDHTYSAGKEGTAEEDNKSLPTLTAINSSNEKSINTNSNQTNRLNVSSTQTQTKLKAKPIVSNQMSITETTVNSELITPGPEPSESDVSIQLEMIPKTELLSDGEDTDSASEADRQTPSTSAQPFLFVSEYLSKNTVFQQILNRNTDELNANKSAEEVIVDKSIEIDLNTDSDHEMNGFVIDEEFPEVDTIFDNEIIDLTPKTTTSKKSGVKRGIKRRIKNKKSIKSKKMIGTKSRQTINSKESEAVSTVNIVNTDNNTSIRDLNASRSLIAAINEKCIKGNKKIVLKGKFYYCKWNKCRYKTQMRANAIRHNWRHTGETPYKCSLCPEGFRDKRRLRAHVMAHNATKAFETPLLATKSAVPLKKGSGDVLCPDCDKRYTAFRALLRHMKTVHGFKKANNYKQKYYSIIEKKSIDKTSIQLTNKTPKTKVSILNNANNSVPSISPKKLAQIPKTAQKLAKTLVKSRNSRRNQKLLKVKHWKCDYKDCENRYFDKHNLKRHQFDAHKKLSRNLFFKSNKINSTKVRYFNPKYFSPTKIADNCNTDNNSNIDNNDTKPVPISTDDFYASDKTFVCNYKNCSNSYQTISGLYKHKKTKHKSNKNFATTAKVCKKFITVQSTGTADGVTDSNDTLVVADNSKPSLGREWICEIPKCGARYVWKQTLQKHMIDKHNITNSGDQSTGESIESGADAVKYDCPYNDCEYQTASRKTLVHHYKTHFTGEDKPFKCLINGCNYSHQFLAKLKNHVLNRHSEQEFFRAMDATGVHYPSWY